MSIPESPAPDAVIGGGGLVAPAGFIIGIGIDLVDIRRIDQTLLQFGDRFKNRLFTEQEIEYCQRKPDPAAAFSKHYAMKEACSKALGTGMRMGVAWRNMTIERSSLKKPDLVLTGGALERLETLTPQGYAPHLHLSLTDEPPYAAAIVTISAVPALEAV